MFVCKLRKWQQRKNMARDYNLVPAFLGKDKKEKERAARRKVTKEEKELRPTLRPLYHFTPCKEFNDLFENMHKKMLRAKIHEPHAAGAMASPRWSSRPSTWRPATSTRRLRRRRWPGRQARPEGRPGWRVRGGRAPRRCCVARLT